MGTLSTLPTQPVSGRECKLVLAATSTGNYIRVWCTDAPPGSKLRTELDSSGASQVSVAEADAGRSVAFTADKGGAYVFRVEEITKGASAFGGVYDTDPNKAPSEAILSVNSITLHFASALTCLLGAGQDTAELLVYVHNASIIATTAEHHGILSPALRKTTTALAKVAAESATVRGALPNLIGAAATALGDTETLITGLINAFNPHLVEPLVHNASDTDNTIDTAFLYASTTEGQKKAVAALRKSLDNHIRNDNPLAATPGTGSATYHAGPGGKVDWGSVVLQVAPSDQLSILVSLADAYRAYEAHRVSDVHEGPDTVNAAPAPSALLQLHVHFLTQLATQNPVNPTNEHSAKTLLVSGGGFKEN
jgi:hypothetical protein